MERADWVGKTRQTWFRNRNKWHKRRMWTAVDKLWYPESKHGPSLAQRVELYPRVCQAKMTISADELHLMARLQPNLLALRDLAYYEQCHADVRLLPREDRPAKLTALAKKAFLRARSFILPPENEKSYRLPSLEQIQRYRQILIEEQHAIFAVYRSEVGL